MKTLKLVASVGLLCLMSASGSPPVHGASGTMVLGILQTELQRNYQVLRKESVPAYFIGYTLHDERNTSVVASDGALQRSDEQRGRFATVEVRVGDYALDNTHPIRGDSGAM